MKPECTLNNEELSIACDNWITELCRSGGKKWCLSIPVNLNKDPDMLFIELIKRFNEFNKSIKVVTTYDKIRMIAEFDGWKMLNNDIDHRGGIYYRQGEANTYWLDGLKYNSSFDWILPVTKKVYEQLNDMIAGVDVAVQYKRNIFNLEIK